MLSDCVTACIEVQLRPRHRIICRHVQLDAGLLELRAGCTHKPRRHLKEILAVVWLGDIDYVHCYIFFASILVAVKVDPGQARFIVNLANRAVLVRSLVKQTLIYVNFRTGTFLEKLSLELSLIHAETFSNDIKLRYEALRDARVIL